MGVGGGGKEREREGEGRGGMCFLYFTRSFYYSTSERGFNCAIS